MNKEDVINFFKDVLEDSATNVEMIRGLITKLGLENDQDVINWADRINAVSVSL